MKTSTYIARGALVAGLLGAVALIALPEREAEASPTAMLSAVDMAGNVIPEFIPVQVAVEIGNTVPEASEWRLVKSIYGTEFLKRLTGASGYVDAGFSSTAGTTFTFDVPAAKICGGKAFETEEILVKIGSVLTFGAPDAGTSTTVLDVGISGATQRFARNVNMLAAANTRVLGSLTNSIDAGSLGVLLRGSAVRNVDPADVSGTMTAYRLTVTQSAKDLTTANGGRIDVYAKCGPVPERQ